PTEKNLVMKAYRLLEAKYNLPAVNIYLHKVIPDGAGLGGGSSDASNTAIALNELFNLNITDDELATMLATIGADCPFFIYNKPLLAGGIGDIFENIDISLKGKTLLLIKPDVSVPTKVAFSRVTPDENRTELKQLITLPIEEWRGVIGNDFELSVFTQYPELEGLKNILYDTGAIYASMSGSGSSIFGVYENDILADSAKGKLAESNCYLLNL
ncbi:MAG: 4-(cytidine 5'-diphospho)-2-C-methyl-D-erythritol kinase, partial [Bacteroidales bacterium]